MDQDNKIEPAEVRDRWREAAPRWRAQGELVATLTEPVSCALVDAANPAPGERWLDIAGGIGDPALLLAGRVGPRGRVVITDLVTEMVVAARERADHDRVRVTAVASAAEALPARGGFHGATCRFGVMFFADADRALAEIRSVLLPRGRAVFAVWGARERNRFFTEVDEAVRDIVPDLPAPDPDGPHAFRYAPPGKLAQRVRAAGWDAVEERELAFTMAAPLTPARLWQHLLGLSPELDALVAELPAERRDRLSQNVEARMDRYFEAGEMRVPAEARLVIASMIG